LAYFLFNLLKAEFNWSASRRVFWSAVAETRCCLVEVSLKKIIFSLRYGRGELTQGSKLIYKERAVTAKLNTAEKKIGVPI
jgi:hypothetical protein